MMSISTNYIYCRYGNLLEVDPVPHNAEEKFQPYDEY
jgi:hypothetical protein